MIFGCGSCKTWAIFSIFGIWAPYVSSLKFMEVGWLSFDRNKWKRGTTPFEQHGHLNIATRSECWCMQISLLKMAKINCDFMRTAWGPSCIACQWCSLFLSTFLRKISKYRISMSVVVLKNIPTHNPRLTISAPGHPLWLSTIEGPYLMFTVRPRFLRFWIHVDTHVQLNRRDYLLVLRCLLIGLADQLDTRKQNWH